MRRPIERDTFPTDICSLRSLRPRVLVGAAAFSKSPVVEACGILKRLGGVEVGSVYKFGARAIPPIDQPSALVIDLGCLKSHEDVLGHIRAGWFCIAVASAQNEKACEHYVRLKYDRTLGRNAGSLELVLVGAQRGSVAQELSAKIATTLAREFALDVEDVAVAV